MKVALLVDSTSSIPQEYLTKNNIYLIEINVAVSEEMCKERSEIDIKDFMAKLPTMEPYPTTSFASPHDALEVLDKIVIDGYKEVIYPFMTPQISNQISSVKLAEKKIKEKLKIHYYPTQLAGPSQAPFIFLAKSMLDEGKKISEIFQRFDELKQTICTIGFSKDFTTLFRTGKINKSIQMSVLTSALKLKPLYEVPIDKGVVGYGGGMGYRGSIKKIMRTLETKIDTKNSFNLVITHANGYKHVKILEENIKSKFNIKDIQYWQIPPAILVSVGLGSVMVTLYPA